MSELLSLDEARARVHAAALPLAAEPVAVAKHGRTVVVVLAVEEYERLKAVEAGAAPKAPGGAQSEE